VTDDHISLDELAELDEGILPPERTSAIRAHLHGCAECQARAAAISDTRDKLANLPPLTMPADIASRLDAAIAAERGASAPSVGAGEVDTDGPDADLVDASSRTSDVVPKAGTVSRPRFGRPSMPAIAVAATFVLAAGAIVIGHLNHGSSPTVSTSGPTGVSGENSVVRSDSAASAASLTLSSTGKTYTATALGTEVQGLLQRRVLETSTAPTPAVPSSAPLNGGGAAAYGSSGGGSGAGSAGQVNGNTKKKADKTHRTNSPPMPSSTPVSSPAVTSFTTTNHPIPKQLLPLYNSRAKILACARTLTGESAVPLTVDFARWSNPPTQKHLPAAVFVFRAATPDHVAVFVTSPACDGTFYSYVEVPLP